MEKIDSVTISTRPFSGASFSSNRSSRARSLWGNARTVAPLNRAASIRLAWASLSSTTVSPLPTSAGIVPSAAANPLLKTSAASVSFHPARSASSASVAESVPVTSREAPAPVPRRAVASRAASINAGWRDSPR